MRRVALTLGVAVAWLAPLLAQVGSAPTVTTASLPNGAVGSAYTAQLAATGGTGSYTWTLVAGAGSLPAGLTLSAGGTISGTPTASGTSGFTVRVTTSAQQTATKALSIIVNAAITIANAGTLPKGTVGVAYTPLTFNVTGGSPPYTFAAVPISPFDPDGLAPGLTVNSNGVLSGTPTRAGTFNFNLLVTDRAGAQGTKPFSMSVAAALSITTASPLPGGVVNVSYSQAINASGGTPPYSFSITNPPPGLTINTGGTLSGTPTATGPFAFNITVTDAAKASFIKPFQLTVTANAPVILVSVTSLTFAAAAGGDSPASQNIGIVNNTSAAVTFRVVLDSGAANTAAPAWLSVKPLNGKTPAVLSVTVDPGTMPIGTYTGRVRIIDSSNFTTDVAVTMVISTNPPILTATPIILRFATLVQSSGVQERLLVVANSGGGGSLAFSTQVLSASRWITDVTPSSGQIRRNSPAFLRVHVDASALGIGIYRDVIHVTTPAGDMDVPVILRVARRVPILSVDEVGVRFHARQGGGHSHIKVLNILNNGDPLSTVNWTAEVLKGDDFLSLGRNTSGAATTSSPGRLVMQLNSDATQADPGGYYALIRISDPKALNSPQYVVAVFDLQPAGTPVAPDPAPEGMFFTSAAGLQPKSQVLTVHASSATAVTFQAGTLTSDGANWLSVDPTSGRTSGANPGTATVSVNTTGLAPGIYAGQVSIAIASEVRIVNIGLVVQPAGTIAASATGPAASCTPGKLAITSTGTLNNFSVPAKWPLDLAVQLNDDCGISVSNGSVIASFSNGDPALSLLGDNEGNYSATWQPGTTSAGMQVTVRAAAGLLDPATVQISGSISQNQAPVLAKDGTLHNLNPVIGGPLAPGNVVQIFGSGLAGATASPGVLPLPSTYNGTTVLIGGFSAPLYYLSDGQINAQIPNELTPDLSYTVIASANGGITLPDTIDLVSVVPGVAAFTDGHIIAQHSDFTLVDAGHPAKAGEFLVMYLVGMGATNPSVASGQPAPSAEPFARVVSQPTVTVDGQSASVAYAGLTPGFAGLYQINFQVPASAKPGDLDVIVTQLDQTANTTQLRVAK